MFNLGIISEERAKFLLNMLDNNFLSDLDSLTLDERENFTSYLKTQANIQDNDSLVPWWEISPNLKITNLDIEDLSA